MYREELRTLLFRCGKGFSKVCQSCCLMHMTRDIRYLLLFHSKGGSFCWSLGHYDLGEVLMAGADGNGSNGLLWCSGWVSVALKGQLQTAQSLQYYSSEPLSQSEPTFPLCWRIKAKQTTIHLVPTISVFRIKMSHNFYTTMTKYYPISNQNSKGPLNQ